MAAKTAEQGEFKGYAGETYTKAHDLPRDNEFLIDKETLVRHVSLDVNLEQG